ncbi:hypothetical protein [uncultured Methanolobus sp.]|uniref:hypothetical protein n=1 Tax=uncultured Methanolobus sp. TaxID=218300 RepID=UPI0029C859C7|nr:hypothetical protein [uncultured Methanolobus sp.]
MVKVQVNVKNLAIDLDGKEMKFRQGDVFDIPTERAKKMGNTLLILEDEEPDESSSEKTTPKRKTAGK